MEKRQLNYGRQTIEQDDIDAVVETLKGDWLTQGPAVELFEKELASYCGAKHAIATCNGTAALFIANRAINCSAQKGITTPITFVATPNGFEYNKIETQFVDIDKGTLNLDLEKAKDAIDIRTKVICPVHFAGLPCDMEHIAWMKKKYGLIVIEDACHALGASFGNDKVGCCKHSEFTVFSFHPVKHITSVRRDTPVLIKENGVVKLVKIGSLMELMLDDYYEPDNYECIAFDKSGKTSWQKIKAFIKHETHSDILKIITQKGRTIEITQSHSIFTIRNGEIVETLGRHLKEGDYLVVPRKLSIPQQEIKEIDLLDYIKKEKIKYNDIEIRRAKGGTKSIPRKLKITKDFCKLLGYFVAEGSYNYKDAGLTFTFGLHEKNTYVAEVKRIFEELFPKFSANVIPNEKYNKCNVVCSGILHAQMFRAFGCGYLAKNKRIPNFIWSVSDENKIAFIEGLLNGDGHKRIIAGCNSNKLGVASKELANGLHYLLLMLGIQSRVSFEQCYSKKGTLCNKYICEILGEIEKQVSVRENCIPVEFLKLTKHSTSIQSKRIKEKKSITLQTINKWGNKIDCPECLKNDVCVLKINKIEKNKIHEYVYDFEVDGLQNFIGGYGAICLHNTGEGGALLTNDDALAERAKRIRNHGISKNDMIYGNSFDAWYYEMQELGVNARITDIQCALGLSQLNKLDRFVKRRKEIAKKYKKEIIDTTYGVRTQFVPNGYDHAYHLFVVILDCAIFDRRIVFDKLKERGVNCQIHYIPCHLQPYYRNKYNYKSRYFPYAENYYKSCLSLPLYPLMTDDDVDYVIKSFKEVTSEYRHSS